MEIVDTDSCGEDLGDLVLALNSQLYAPPIFNTADGLKKVIENCKGNGPIQGKPVKPLALGKLNKTLVPNSQNAKEESTNRSFNMIYQSTTLQLSDNRDGNPESPERRTDRHIDSQNT